MSMQPSEDEILREVEALRDIKRRSTAQGGPGILTIDPDLPELSSSPSSAHSSSTWSGSNGSISDSSNPNVINDPSHLFWVPAHLHPEIAPQEFREFLKGHSRDAISGTSSNDPDLLSPGSSKVSRRKSMLSRQYKPSETDGVEDEQVIIRSNTISSRATPQLTINDLQKLDEIAQAVSQGEDISNISTMLRRSLSLNSTEMADHKPLSPNMDDTDSPIIVPLPNQILRRAARTKIRKPSLQGDGGGHRFPSSRRAVRSNTISTTDGSEHDHADSFMRVTREHETESDHRPSSYTDETSILDSYSDKRDSLTSSESHGRSEDDHRSAPSPLPFQIPLVSTTPQLQLDLHPFEFSLTTPPATFHEPIPQQSTIPSAFDVLPSRSPSPTPSDTGSTEVISSPPSPAPSSNKDTQPPSNDLLPASQTSRQLPVTISHSPHPRKDKDKEKEKKGLFGKWGSDKKKSKTEVTRTDGKDPRDREKEKEKDSGFFGSLFGGKKKPEEFNNIGLSHENTNSASATALLGASKINKPNIRTPSPQPSGSYARYPIHVERAIYRLSHIKLANARRPLLEQVLISNLMFWYLGIINKPATTNPPSTQNQTFEQITQQTAQGTPQEKEVPFQERENMECEAKEVSEFARRETGRKGSLSRGGKPIDEAGARRTEVPIRGPQYGSQYRAMEQEFTPTSSHNYNGGGYPNQGPSPSPSVARTGSAPAAAMSSSPVHQQYSNQKLGLTPHQVAQNRAIPTSHSTSQSSNAYENVHLYHPQPVHQPANASYVLPPGAMSPQIGFDKTWQNPTSRSTSTTSASQGPYIHSSSPSPPPPTTTSTITNQQQSSQSPPPRQPRSPPPQNYPSNTRSRSVTPPGGRVSRSVSAETFPQGANLKKKSFQPSNTDLKPHRRLSDVDSPGDDVPLAVWQQQHRAAGTNHQYGASA